MEKNALDWGLCDVIPYDEDYKSDELKYEKWKEIRRGFIGGSDAGAFNPNSKYKSPFCLYYSKKGENEFKGNKATKRGDKLEPAIRSWMAEELGVEIKTCPYALVSKEHPFMGVNLDGVIVDDDGKKIGVEIKTSKDGYGFNYVEQEIPDDYYYQVQHAMAVTGIDKFYLGAFVMSSDDLDIYTVHRDEEFIKNLIAAEKDFWENYYLKGITPAPSFIDGEEEILNSNITGVAEVVLNDEIKKTIEEYNEIKKEETLLKSKKDNLSIEIKKYLIDNAQFVSDGDKKKIIAKEGNISISYSTSTNSRLDSTELKKKKPEIYQEFLTESETSRLTVTIKD